jgi:hypothetical protein
VIRAPEPSGASTTTQDRASPAMILFRSGKRYRRICVSGGFSATRQPPSSSILAARPRLAAG